MEVCLEVTRIQLAKNLRFVKELKVLGEMERTEDLQDDAFQWKISGKMMNTVVRP
jgi:hypothetical protein